MNFLLWLVPLVVFAVTVAIGLITYPHKTYLSCARKVKRYESRDLKFVWDNNDQFVRLRGSTYIIRVGLQTLGEDINNVSVTLPSYDDSTNAFVDEPLNPASAQHYGVSPYFNISRGETKFVEILSYNPENQTMGIIYHKNYQYYFQALQTGKTPQEANQLLLQNPFRVYSDIPCDNHIFRLYATGANTKETQAIVSIKIQNRKPEFEVKNEKGQVDKTEGNNLSRDNYHT